MCAMGHCTSHATFVQPRKLYVQQFFQKCEYKLYNSYHYFMHSKQCFFQDALSWFRVLALLQLGLFCCWSLACCAHTFDGSVIAFLVYMILLKKTDFTFNFMYICSLCCNALKTHSSLRQQIPLHLGGLPAYIICRGRRQLLNKGCGANAQFILYFFYSKFLI